MKARWLALTAVAVLAVSGCTTSPGAVAPDASPPLAGTYPAPGEVSLFPNPGSVTASPTTQLSFRGVTAAQLGPVSVTGSDSGVHTGRLLTHSDGRGVSFVPLTPFTPGERVTVSTTLVLRGVGTGTGTFTVAHPAEVPTSSFGPTVTASAPASSARRYASRPDLSPPLVQVRTGTEPSGGLLLLTPSGSPSGAGPMVTDTDGSLVWFDPLPNGTAATDLEVQSYHGVPVLTWWQGTVLRPGYGRGTVELVDRSYRKVATVSAGNGYDADLHDVVLTSDGTALLTVYTPIEWDARSIGGPADAAVLDGVVQEVDIATGAVQFEWHALDHVPLSESVLPAPTSAGAAYDYFHLNSVDPGPTNDLLVSSRHTDALFDIDRATGQVRWQLGGRGSDFTVAGDARFAYQHDARWRPDGTITLFDNAARTDQVKVTDQSSALWLRLDTATMTASLVRRYQPPSALLATSQGNLQVLAGGAVMVGWGSEPNLTEYDRAGQVVYDASLSLGNSYRAFLQPWVGAPVDPPSWTASPPRFGTTVAVSWNGDTRTRTWQLLSGPDPAHLDVVASAARTGFETVLTSASAGPWLAVRALDADGVVLATSSARRTFG